MKAFYRLLIITIIFIALIFTGANLLLQDSNIEGRQYRVDISRAAFVIETAGLDSLNLSDYETLRAVVPVKDNSDLCGEKYDCLIREINGNLYRFDYTANPENHRTVLVVNLMLGLMALLVISILFYVQIRILRPFDLMREVPIALAKGNLASPIQENRQKFFGRFVWGMNMLRENMEKQKEKELSLQAEKKKLILSISHDIKIPLSAIKLYAKALERGIYDENRKNEIAGKINEKADEITLFVSKIVQASSEDFLVLDVNNGEFYLSDLLNKLDLYYKEKLKLLNIDFNIEKAGDCLLLGDSARALEVIQNIVENAIKYGDGVSVDIRVGEEDGCRLISVENSGCTLSPDDLPHMFDSFWRGTNASDKEGSGLGLYICRSLMLKMGGDIFAEIKDNKKMCVTAVFYCP